MKGLSAKAVHQKLVQTLGAEAATYPRVTWYLHATKFLAQSQEATDEPEVTPTDSVGVAILKALTNN
jgi:hypothetical protein